MIRALARLAGIVRFVLVAADTERGLTRRAAVERALENAFETGIEPGILVVPDREDRRRAQARPRERRRLDAAPPSDHAGPPLQIPSSLHSPSTARDSRPPTTTPIRNPACRET